MPRNLYSVANRTETIRFARIFVRRRLKGFKKDINICLAGGPNDDKAFMPALMATISLLDLLSGLYAGRVEGHNDVEFVDFFKTFMPGRYNEYELKVLYIAFRHKLAHLSHPYFVLNTVRRAKLNKQPMLLAWAISSDAHEPPIKIRKLPRSRLVRGQPVPWKTRMDHVIDISIRTLAEDAIKVAAAYIKRLQSDPDLWKKFKDCMPEFYQT